MQSGDDYLSLEDFDSSGQKYYFNMYGPASKQQSFAQDPDNYKAVGDDTRDAETAMVVMHPHMTTGTLRKPAELYEVKSKAKLGVVVRGIRVKVIKMEGQELEVEIVDGAFQGHRGVIATDAFASD